MSLPIDKAIRKAQSHIKAGELAEAEDLYKQVLSKFPKNKKAIQGYQKLKGGIAPEGSSTSEPSQEQVQELLSLYNQGEFEEVLSKVRPLISVFSKAITLFNLQGAANAALQKYDLAIDSYKQVLKIKPDNAGAYYNTGVMQHENGEIDAAIESYQRATKIKHDYAAAYLNMGDALHEKQDLDAAICSYKQVIKIKPDDADAYYNIGTALKDKGELDIAIDSYKQAIKIKPDHAKAYYNMGIALKDKGELDAAIDSHKQAIKIKPDHAGAYYNMGNVLNEKGELDAAIDSHKQAIRIKPDHAEAYNNMGIALKDKGELDAAIYSYRQAIKIKPDYADAYNNMGNALNDKAESDAAIDSYKQALKIKPDYAEAYYNMGISLINKGEMDAAVDSYEKAIKIKPDYELAHSGKLYRQAHVCDWSGIERGREVIPKLGISAQYINPFEILPLEDAPERHRLRSEVFAKNEFKQKPLPLASRSTQKPKRLRIGYFSSDFKEHPVAYLMAKVIETHDRNFFEVYGYSIGPAKDDKMRHRLIKGFDVFDDVQDMSDQDVALLARQDQIDIAIDLTGYTQNSRSGIFAYRAAPMQINYLGYPGTMGANFIDYIIADPILIPSDSQKHYNEKIIQLPNSYMPTDNTRIFSERELTRLEMGLPEQGFVFCCFNNNYKISPTEFDVWMRLLLKVEGSVLWLRKSNKWSEGNFCKEAKSRGIDPSRLIFADRVPMDEHLARHRLADLFLDTFAFNAHTTATEALWAGLPVVTKLGQGFAARVAGSLLTAIELPELITETEMEYEALILDLATNPQRLAAIKQKLAANRLSKPLFNTELFTKHLEDGYQRAYGQYFDGKEPEAIYVPE